MAIDTLERFRIEPCPEFADILRDEPFATGVQADSDEWINRAFDRLILQSGTGLSGAVALRLCLLFAVAAGGSAFVLCENLAATGLTAALGAVVPVAVLALARRRRREKFAAQLPAVVEQIIRAARAGDGLKQCLEKTAARTPAPLGEELRLAMRRTHLGLTLAESLSELPARTGLTAAQVLVSAINISERYGKHPAETLEHLAGTLRERTHFARRLFSPGRRV